MSREPLRTSENKNRGAVSTGQKGTGESKDEGESREDGRNRETIVRHEQEERPRERSSKMHTAPRRSLGDRAGKRLPVRRIRSALVNRGRVAVDLAIGSLTMVGRSGR